MHDFAPSKENLYGEVGKLLGVYVWMHTYTPNIFLTKNIDWMNE